MRKELLKRRTQINMLINDINMSIRDCSKEESFKLVKLKKEKINEYQFINNLLKAL